MHTYCTLHLINLINSQGKQINWKLLYGLAVLLVHSKKQTSQKEHLEKERWRERSFHLSIMTDFFSSF